MSRGLLRNSAANFIAAALPAVAMLVTLPFIVRYLGTAQYGMLTMVMAITGYFAVVDVNVTAGSVKYISEYHARDDLDRVYQVISFGSLFYFSLALLGGIGIFLAAPTLVDWLFKLPADQIDLAIDVMRLAGAGFFFGQLQAYLNTVPQALHRYDLTSVAETFFGILVPSASLLLLWLGWGLKELVMLRVVSSALHLLVLVAITSHLLPGFSFMKPTRDTSRKLWSFSSYSYLSRLSAMTYAQADKIIVGSLLGMSALAHYSVATQIIGRITGLTFRLSSVLYPAASAMEARGEMDCLKTIYFTGSRYVAYINGAIILLVCLFGREILFYWMGPEFAGKAYWVMVFTAVALFMDSITNLPSLLNDAFGYPRNTGIFAMLRAVFATAIVYALAKYFDIGVVALGHTLSALVFAVWFLVFVHGRSIPWSFMDLAKAAYTRPFAAFIMVIGVVVLIRPSTVMPWQLALGGGFLSALMILALGYFWILDREHRKHLWTFLAFFKHAPAAGKQG